MSTPRAMIALDRVTKAFGAQIAVEAVSFEVAPGEFFSLLGPSGCGKSTLLRMIAGIEQPSSGDIVIDGQSMAGVPANRRPTNMVFQNYAIFPHLNVDENIGYGLRNMALSRAEAAARVREAISLVKLDGLGTRNAHQLSGGQRQRVALARALVCRPKVLLLDEPLSALDKNLRQAMQVELRALQRTVGITFVFVTHDQEEALTMSDRIAVMNRGHVEQIGTPAQIYNRPATPFVADFIGTLNRIGGEVVDPAAGELRIAGVPVRLGAPVEAAAGGTVTLAVRPEAVRLGRDPDCDVTLPGEVAELRFLGPVIRIRLALGEDQIALDIFNRPGADLPQVGARAEISLRTGDIIVQGGGARRAG
ncbi:ABC transporter ATP-binding protein [Albidovulum sp.]